MASILESIDAMINGIDDEPLMELTFKKVVRNGQVIKKLVCPEGFKSEDGRCVRMQMAELKKRHKAAKKAVKTKKKTFKGINKLMAEKSRRKSDRLRQIRHL